MPTLTGLLRRLFASDATARPAGVVAPGRLSLAAGDLAPSILDVRDALQRVGTDPAALYNASHRLPHVYPHVLTEFAARRNSLTGIGFEVALPEGAVETPQTARSLDRMQAAFTDRGRRAVIAASQSALADGLAPAELHLVEGRGGNVVLRGLHPIPLDRFFWTGGELRYSPTGRRADARQLDETEQAKLLCPHYTAHTPQTDEQRYGGLMRYAVVACSLAWFTLYESIRQTERMGKPVRIGRYPAGLDPRSAEVGQLRQAVWQMGRDLGAMIPDDMKLEVLNVTSGQSTAYPSSQILDRLDAGVSKLFLGTPMLTNESTHGTRAQADVQTRVADDLFLIDIERAEETGQDVLDRLWVADPTGGSTLEPCPFRFRSTYQRRGDTEGLAHVVEVLARHGHRPPITWVERTFGVPAARDGEPALGDGPAIPPEA